MKIIKTATLSTLILLSASAFSNEFTPPNDNFFVYEKTSSLDTQTTKTQDEAYQLGLKKLTQLYAMSPIEQSKVLNTNLFIEKKLTHINDGGYVTVEEIMKLDGSILYKAKINFSYHVSEEDLEIDSGSH
tara:strand:+ start:38921 stop:39310 length:390 start_codon:yes stop_codon:yes gene_type:complete